jgi:choline dehydrogenase-like flavoprotein
MDEQTGLIDARAKPQLGRYLHDHLSLRVARVEVLDWRRFMELFAPAFTGNTMRSLRVELDPGIALREGLPPFYAHFVAEAPQDSGFAALRDLLRGLQQRRASAALRGALRLPRALPGVAEIAWWRLARRRLAFPRGPGLYLHLDVEQAPCRDNRVYGGDRVGSMARRTCRVDWEPDLDPGAIAQVAGAHLAKFWSRNNLQRVARLAFVDAARLRAAWPTNLYDIYHPAGTMRMAATADAGVVDADARIFGTENLYVAGSAVFPSMGAANPTFTAMALALRMADRLGLHPHAAAPHVGQAGRGQRAGADSCAVPGSARPSPCTPGSR